MANREVSDSARKRTFWAVLCLIVVLVGGLVVFGIVQIRRVMQDSWRQSVIIQLHFAIQMYTNDYDDRLPPAGRWARAIRPYFNDDRELAGCEGISSPSGSPCGYCFNQSDSGRKASEINPSIAVVWENREVAAAKGNVLYWGRIDGDDDYFSWPVKGQLPPRHVWSRR